MTEATRCAALGCPRTTSHGRLCTSCRSRKSRGRPYPAPQTRVCVTPGCLNPLGDKSGSVCRTCGWRSKRGLSIPAPRKVSDRMVLDEEREWVRERQQVKKERSQRIREREAAARARAREALLQLGAIHTMTRTPWDDTTAFDGVAYETGESIIQTVRVEQ